jgi:hypothetical protein
MAAEVGEQNIYDVVVDGDMVHIPIVISAIDT